MSRSLMTTSKLPRLADRLCLVWTCGAVCAALAGPVGAQIVGDVSPRVASVQGGLFCAPAAAGRRPAPETMSGWIHVPDEPVVMFATGFQAPAVLGLGFGVRYQMAPGASASVRYTVTHPPIPPSGITTQHWNGTVSGDETDTAFFQFDIPEEMQTGDWSFTITADGETLFTAAFTVTRPEDLPALANQCRNGSLLSALRNPADPARL